MDSGLCEKRINVNVDRLSSLPDNLIHKIFSSFDIKHVIETSVLSSRWRYIWTSMPYLNFSTNGFPLLLDFTKFVTNVLSCRNNEVDVFSVKLSFRGKASQVFVKRILKYAFSHNVQHMTISLFTSHSLNHQKSIGFPLSLFSSHSLKHLTLSGTPEHHRITLTSPTWELPSITTLHLEFIIFDDVITNTCIDLFSKCTNLKNLTLNHCKIMGSHGFTIFHPHLCNLTFKNEHWALQTVNVVAPQLKNMSLALGYFHYLQFYIDRLPSLEKVDLCLSDNYIRDPHKIVRLLQQFQSVKFLTLNLEIIEALASIREQILNQPSPFANLKRLQIYPLNIHSRIQLEGNVSAIVKNYLVDSSAEPTLTMVSYEEMTAMNNAGLAQKRMEELRVLLHEEKENFNRARAACQKTPKQNHKGKMHEKGKAQIDNQVEQPATEMSHHIRGRIEKIESCWGNLSWMFQLEKTKVFGIFLDLENIESLLKELPASKRETLQACFSSLCAEADIALNKYIDRMKIQCDTKINSRLTLTV